jgi:hypothetical protein
LIDDAPPLERRLRRLALLVPAFAIAGAAFGFVPHGFDIVERSFKNDHIIAQTTSIAGGYSLAVWAALHGFVAATVRAAPKRSTGWKWFVASVLLAICGGVGWLVERFTLADQLPRWPAHAMIACVGCAVVLTTIALPVVLIASANDRPEVPPARIA